VLDIGADSGSTAGYFLLRRAKKVVAVEGNILIAQQLYTNYGRHKKVICIRKWVTQPEDIEKLVSTYQPDLAKVDIENGEECLLSTQKEILSLVKEWLIETHSVDLTNLVERRFLSIGYNVKMYHPFRLEIPNMVIYASKNG